MKCENCTKYDDCRIGSGLTWPCGAYRPKTITNADRIRAMGDEEMALQFGANCPKGNRRICDKACSKCWLEWLQQPVEEEA